MTEPKKLYRIPSKGKIAGVCAGLAEYLSVDVTTIRLIFILLLIFGSSGGLIYLIMLLLLPIKPGDFESV